MCSKFIPDFRLMLHVYSEQEAVLFSIFQSFFFLVKMCLRFSEFQVDSLFYLPHVQCFKFKQMLTETLIQFIDYGTGKAKSSRRSQSKVQRKQDSYIEPLRWNVEYINRPLPACPPIPFRNMFDEKKQQEEKRI